MLGFADRPVTTPGTTRQWQPLVGSNHGPPPSEGGALAAELSGYGLVSVGGFEPPVPCFQGRQDGGPPYTLAMEIPVGVEPTCLCVRSAALVH